MKKFYNLIIIMQRKTIKRKFYTQYVGQIETF
jgi:hypothetical protein